MCSVMQVVALGETLQTVKHCLWYILNFEFIVPYCQAHKLFYYFLMKNSVEHLTIWKRGELYSTPLSLSQSLLFSPPLFVPLSLSVCLRKRTSLLLNYYTMCLEHAGLKAVQCMKHKLMMISLTRIYTCRALCEVWVEVKFLILSLIQDKTLSVNPFHRICVCLSMPVSCTDVVLGYCYGRESREAASWRQELGQIWQILDYTVYGQPANKVCRKQATGCSACLCKGSLVQDQVEIYSQPLPSACQLYNPWLFLFKYKPETYSTASSP